MAVITVVAGTARRTSVPLGVTRLAARLPPAGGSSRRRRDANRRTSAGRRPADRLVRRTSRWRCRRSWRSRPRPDREHERAPRSRAVLVARRGAWVYVAATRGSPQPRRDAPRADGRLLRRAAGRSAPCCSRATTCLLHLPDHRLLPRHRACGRGRSLIVGVFATSILVNSAHQRVPDRRRSAWTIYVAIIVRPDARDRRRRAASASG